MLQLFRYILFILLLTPTNLLIGQNQDQILKAEELLISTSGKERVALLNELSRLYIDIDPDKSVEYTKEIVILTADDPIKKSSNLYNLGNLYRRVNNYRLALDCQTQALEIRRQINDIKGTASCLNNIGEIYKILNKHEEALNYFNQSLKIRQKEGSPKEVAYTLNNIGSTYWLKKDYASSLEFYLKSLEIRSKLGDKSDISSSLNNLGNVYKNLGKYNKALDYYAKALEIRQEIGDKTLIAFSMNDIGGIYWRLNNYNESLSYYNKSLALRKEIGNKRYIAATLKNIGTVYKDLNELDYSLKSYNESLKIYDELNDLKEQANVFSSIGKLYESYNNFDKSLEYHKIALNLHRQIGNTKGIAYSSNSIGEILMKYFISEEAKTYLLSAFEHANQCKDRSLQKITSENLFEYFSNQGDYKKALEYFREFSSTQYDSIVDQIDKGKIAEFEANYEISKNKNEIKSLKAYSRQQTIVIYLFIALIILAGGIGYIANKNIKIRKEATQALTEKNTELEEINSRLKETEVSLRDLNLTKDKIFNIISNDLRTPFNDMKVMSSKLIQSFEQPEIGSQKDLSQNIRDLSFHTSDLVEKLLSWSASQSGKTKFAARAFNLKELLDYSLSKLSEQQIEKNVKIIFNLDSTIKAFADTASMTETFKNLLSNAIKFSYREGKITISAREKKYLVELEITDEGVGMSKTNLHKIFRLDNDYLALGTAQEKGAGIGLLLCKEYVEKNGGKIWADSEEGKGSSFFITIPKSDKLMGSVPQANH
ncbi:tetratricopeptide repeat-containing sensor histidine kinase [Labilibaculum sp. DW002]|uniref:histidine kinase n=1 Tax=Paralabilibaculum antarcticum TaxID=2912572 RepID=A0ABT5VSQ1_9BACT|nr:MULTISPECIES: tetratricopeptide repeat-containing sensor histidine kinase [unclassified Labilibaculum]MBI9056130.1 tetratricopeptide repeat-containing sensor histidine kinase [Labilibaculum sp.]MDE5418433.1 tetratricopeptide repeat-containing sensor histidine kinase [Labilibaculum sp. DW002]